MTFAPEELRLDVEELTESLRRNAGLGDFRDELLEKGVDWRTALLAAFVENQEGEEHGAIVTSAGKVYRFVRDQGEDGVFRLTQFADATGDPPLREDFRDEIEVALGMLGESIPK